MRGFEKFLVITLAVSGVCACLGMLWAKALPFFFFLGPLVLVVVPFFAGATVFLWTALLAGFYVLFRVLHALTKRPLARTTARNRAALCTLAAVFLAPLAVNAWSSYESRAFEAGASAERIATPTAGTYLQTPPAYWSDR